MSRSGITTKNGHFVQVSRRDLAKVRKMEWHATARGRFMYAQTQARPGLPRVYMHRIIMRAKKGQTVDHRDRNGLNNFRRNLRFISKAENNMNSTVRRSKSGFRGVRKDNWNKGLKAAWLAGMTVKGRNVYLGRFMTAREAALAYDRAVCRLYGRIAYPCLNFPVGTKL